MEIAPNDMMPIIGEHRTTWSVLPGGTHIRLD